MKKLQTASLLFAVLMLGLALSGCDRFLVPENRRTEPLPSSERWPREVVPAVSAEGSLLESWENALSTLPNDIPAESVSQGVLWVMVAGGAGWANLASPLPAWHLFAMEASAMTMRNTGIAGGPDRMRLGLQDSLPLVEPKVHEAPLHPSN